MTGPHYEIIRIDDISEEEYQRAFDLLSESRQKRIGRTARMDDRRRSIAADILGRRLASTLLSVSADSIMIDQLDSGQPVIPGTECCISLSHSGRWVMGAVYDRPVGVDIEEISSRGERIIDRVCSAGEESYIMESGAYDPVRFFEVWTAKEAVLKRAGTGLSGGLGQTIVADENGLLPCVNELTLISGKYEEAVFAVVY